MNDIKFTKPSSMSKTLEIKDEKDNQDNTWRLDQDDRKYENYYNCCCSKEPTDRRLLEFIVKVGFGVAVMLFSMHQLLDADLSCESSAVYVGLLSSVLGWFFPSPSIN